MYSVVLCLVSLARAVVIDALFPISAASDIHFISVRGDGLFCAAVHSKALGRFLGGGPAFPVFFFFPRLRMVVFLVFFVLLGRDKYREEKKG